VFLDGPTFLTDFFFPEENADIHPPRMCKKCCRALKILKDKYRSSGKNKAPMPFPQFLQHLQENGEQVYKIAEFYYSNDQYSFHHVVILLI
jgi:hypothetical protein